MGRGRRRSVASSLELVLRGLYRRVRNPMYLGLLAVVIGWAVYDGSVRLVEYAVMLAVLFHPFVVLVEEPLFRRRFGAAYAAYCRTVPRWIPW